MIFSIIVPVYNAGQYLKECIASVLRQQCADFELILVDDGSEARCAAACDAAAENEARIRVLHQKNAGPLQARLNGVRAARGTYCLFLDADDLLVPDCLLKLKDAIDRYHAPDLLIYSYYTEAPDGERRAIAPVFETEQTFTSETKEALYRLCFSGTAMNTVWTKAVKRVIPGSRQPDYARFSALRCGEDRLQAMAMLSSARTVVYLPDPLYVYRLFDGSATRQFSLSAVDRFDTSAAYPFEVKCLQEWGLYSADALDRLHAAYIAQTLYVFSLFYGKLAGREDKNALIDYPWEKHLPKESLDGYATNPYLNDVQKKLAVMLFCRDKRGLTRFFRRKKRIKALCALKRKLLP